MLSQVLIGSEFLYIFNRITMLLQSHNSEEDLAALEHLWLEDDPSSSNSQPDKDKDSMGLCVTRVGQSYDATLRVLQRLRDCLLCMVAEGAFHKKVALNRPEMISDVLRIVEEEMSRRAQKDRMKQKQETQQQQQTPQAAQQQQQQQQQAAQSQQSQQQQQQQGAGISITVSDTTTGTQQQAASGAISRARDSRETSVAGVSGLSTVTAESKEKDKSSMERGVSGVSTLSTTTTSTTEGESVEGAAGSNLEIGAALANLVKECVQDLLGFIQLQSSQFPHRRVSISLGEAGIDEEQLAGIESAPPVSRARASGKPMAMDQISDSFFAQSPPVKAMNDRSTRISASSTSADDAVGQSLLANSNRQFGVLQMLHHTANIPSSSAFSSSSNQIAQPIGMASQSPASQRQSLHVPSPTSPQKPPPLSLTAPPQQRFQSWLPSKMITNIETALKSIRHILLYYKTSVTGRLVSDIIAFTEDENNAEEARTAVLELLHEFGTSDMKSFPAEVSEIFCERVSRT